MKTNWKYIFFVLVLTIIVGGGILEWVKREKIKLTEFSQPEESEKVIEEPGEEEISCLNIDKNLDLAKTKEKIYIFADPKTHEHLKKNYWIGKGKFKPFEKVDPLMESIMELGVYNNDEEITKIDASWFGASLWCFSFNNKKYVILRAFTGGAHCCTQNYIFLLTPTDDLKFLKNIETEFDEISLSSFVFKNGKLYIKILDSRFEYFFGPHPSAFYVDQHFLVDGEKIILDNSEFKEEYIQKAKKKTKECSKTQNLAEKSPLLCIGEVVVNYLLAGEEKIAWETAKRFFETNIKNEVGNRVTFEDFKKEIEERLAEPVFYY